MVMVVRNRRLICNVWTIITTLLEVEPPIYTYSHMWKCEITWYRNIPLGVRKLKFKSLLFILFCGTLIHSSKIHYPYLKMKLLNQKISSIPNSVTLLSNERELKCTLARFQGSVYGLWQILYISHIMKYFFLPRKTDALYNQEKFST